MKISYKKISGLFVFLITAAVFIWMQVSAKTDRNLSIYFLDVGQGDATYIRTPGNHDVVIDGGPDNKVLEKLGTYMPVYDKKIELMILTHPHEDHIAGLVEILKRYEVDQVIYTGVEYSSAVYDIWKNILDENGINKAIGQGGQIIKLEDVEIDLMYPFDNMNEKTIENVNNSSIVSKIKYGSSSAVIMGDAEQEVEKELIKYYPSDLSDILLLKAGHHGSKTSSSLEFISLIAPKFAIISVGLNNRYNHPHSNTLDTFDKADIEVFRTDVNGDVKCVSYGESYTCMGM